LLREQDFVFDRNFVSPLGRVAQIPGGVLAFRPEKLCAK
jgi:hypothetical protein